MILIATLFVTAQTENKPVLTHRQGPPAASKQGHLCNGTVLGRRRVELQMHISGWINLTIIILTEDAKAHTV